MPAKSHETRLMVEDGILGGARDSQGHCLTTTLALNSVGYSFLKMLFGE